MSQSLQMAGRPSARDIVALIVLSGIIGLNTVDRNMFGLLLPQIQEDIQISDTALGFLMGPAFVIVYSFAGVPIAWLADRTSRKNIIVAGLAFWSGVTIATGFAMNMFHLLVARMTLGVGEASNMAPTSALIGDKFTGRHRVMAMAVFSAGGPLAIMAFYPLIGWVASEHGWRPAYPMMGIIGLIVALLTFFVVKDSKREKVATSAHLAGETGAQDDGRLSFPQAAKMAFKSKAFLLLCAGGTMVSMNYSALLAWLPSFMLRVHDLDAQQTGNLLGMYKGFVGVTATLACGVLVTWLMRFDRRWLAWAPAILCLLMVPAQLMLLLADAPIWWHIGLAFETVLLSGITPCLFALVITLLDPRMRATGTALYLLIFNLVGQGIGPLAVGMLSDGAFAEMGEGAIRYSLLLAPVAVAFGGIIFLFLSFAMKSDAADRIEDNAS